MGNCGARSEGSDGGEKELPEELKGCDPQLVERIENEIIDRGDPVTFDDIAGLDLAKTAVEELVIWPMKRPDLFTVREPAIVVDKHIHNLLHGSGVGYL